jgi:pyruvate/2-oxoglutarate dehydrogenase complex dihydrolipoamide acyltransferase (E2) component
MRVPQVSERVKELPAQALRGVFAGIGQVLLLTDKLMNKTPAGQQVPQARGPQRKEAAAEPPKETPTAKAAPAAETAKTAPAAKTAPTGKAAPAAKAAPTRKVAPTEKAPEARDLDKTGNVRLLDGAGAGAGGATKAAEVPVTAEAQMTFELGEAAEAPVAEEADAPLPNYDELSVASLRARLRNLGAAQVKQMAEYERAHAARADVITMFERRIAKLEAGG